MFTRCSSKPSLATLILTYQWINNVTERCHPSITTKQRRGSKDPEAINEGLYSSSDPLHNRLLQ